jgi:N-acetylglucosamine-6-phosphate deacetylase
VISNLNHGEICGCHYATRQPIRLRWHNGIITHTDPAALASSSSIHQSINPPLHHSTAPSQHHPTTPTDWLAPPLFDLQINGYAGVDFQQDNLSMDDLLSAARGLRAAGCARFLLTLITDDWPKLTARLRRLRSLRSQSAELQCAIVGWHVEGPFLSAEPGYHGAHNPALMRDPAPEHILELRTITGDDPLLLTLAPERPGALPAIELAVSRGIKVSLGHTNASAETLRQAVQAGATGFTHLGNGCPRDLDRHDNILWRVFETPGLTVSLISDRVHVSPPLFRLAHWVLGGDSIYYTTDAMSAAGAPPGRYTIGSMALEVGPDQIVRQPGKPLFAGSALRPIEGVFRAAQMLGSPWQEVWPRLSEAPARLMGLRNDLAVGQPATFCLLKAAGENQLLDPEIYVSGPKTELISTAASL